MKRFAPSRIDWQPPETIPKDSDHELLVDTRTHGIVCGFAESAPDNLSDVVALKAARDCN